MKRLAVLAAAVLAAITLPACAHGVGGLARLTVIDRTTNVELPVHWKDGRAYVAGQPGNEYQIRLRNVAGEDLLAVVSVDGVNVITGQTAQHSQSGYILGSYRSMDVAGWRKDMQRTASFYFTTLPDSYAARTGRPDNVGVIGVALYKRKAPDPAPFAEPERPAPFAKQESAAGTTSPAAPAVRNDSRERAQKQAQADSPLGTGHGRQERNPTYWAEFERSSPYPVETITLYYDSTRNLVAQGVIRAPAPRDPNPFPGFVPDPVSQLRFWHRPPGA
jgi:pyruvate/2-oxoglutarate dehydrogenase complex dihydrolipoamide acyltransferase (E2) component